MTAFAWGEKVTNVQEVLWQGSMETEVGEKPCLLSGRVKEEKSRGDMSKSGPTADIRVQKSSTQEVEQAERGRKGGQGCITLMFKTS